MQQASGLFQREADHLHDGHTRMQCNATNERIFSTRGLFSVPVSPVILAGLRPAAKEEVCWRGCTAATPAHLLRLSDPRAGREHIRHTMQFRKTKKPCFNALESLHEPSKHVIIDSVAFYMGKITTMEESLWNRRRYMHKN